MDRSPEGGHHVHDPGILGDPAPRLPLDQVPLVLHLQAPAAGIGDAVELGLDPAPGRSDPPGVGQGVGEGVAGAEGDEGADVGLQARS